MTVRHSNPWTVSRTTACLSFFSLLWSWAHLSPDEEEAVPQASPPLPPTHLSHIGAWLAATTVQDLVPMATPRWPHQSLGQGLAHSAGS